MYYAGQLHANLRDIVPDLYRNQMFSWVKHKVNELREKGIRMGPSVRMLGHEFGHAKYEANSRSGAVRTLITTYLSLLSEGSLVGRDVESTSNQSLYRTDNARLRIYLWVRNYMRSNPESSVHEAVSAVCRWANDKKWATYEEEGVLHVYNDVTIHPMSHGGILAAMRSFDSDFTNTMTKLFMSGDAERKALFYENVGTLYIRLVNTGVIGRKTAPLALEEFIREKCALGGHIYDVAAFAEGYIAKSLSSAQAAATKIVDDMEWTQEICLSPLPELNLEEDVSYTPVDQPEEPQVEQLEEPQVEQPEEPQVEQPEEPQVEQPESYAPVEPAREVKSSDFDFPEACEWAPVLDFDIPSSDFGFPWNVECDGEFEDFLQDVFPLKRGGEELNSTDPKKACVEMEADSSDLCYLDDAYVGH